jgi:hypothetical protein
VMNRLEKTVCAMSALELAEGPGALVRQLC